MSGRSVEQSWELHRRAVGVTPMATQTHSKAPRPALREVEPCFLVRGEGCRVWDVDGNQYIDFRNGLGPISLGYAYPSVNEAIAKQLQDGVVFSYAHPLEVEVAERLTEIIPCAEKVRFLKTGGEAMAAAHRLARGFTGRDHILTCGYHGWVNSMREGVPAATKSTYTALPWGNVDAFQTAIDTQGADDIAAISVACDYAEIEQGHQFLPALRAMCDRIGALLIFDEIVTGFRLRRAGAQEYFDVTPDLAVFAKGISNGVPLSVYLGRADVMDAVKSVVISSTFGGDTLGLAAASAVLDVYEQEDVIGTLWARGQQLHTGFGELAERHGVDAGFSGLPPVGLLRLPTTEDRVRFEGECLRQGVITFSVYYPSYSHSEADIDEALEAQGRAVQQLKNPTA